MVLNGSDPAGRTVPPVIGMTTYLQQAQTGVWDVRRASCPPIYFEGVNLAGGVAVAAAAAAGRRGDRRPGARRRGRPGHHRRPRRRSRPLRAATPPAHRRARTRPRRLGVRAGRGALRRGIPVLGICRGAQVLNVALGGTLHQHLPDVIGHTHHQKGNAVFGTSAVRTVPGTRLAALIGETSDAQCYHHQAIDRLGDGLIVSARDADGVIEAVELADGRRTLRARRAVAPEERLDDLRLFAACGGRRGRNLCDRKGLMTPAQESSIRPPRRCCAASSSTRRRRRGRRGGAGRSRRSGSWARLAPAERAAALRAFAAAVDAHVDELAALEVANSGHPIGKAEWEAGHVRDVLQFYSGQPGTVVRQADSGGRRARRHLQRAARRGRGDHAVELPDDDRVVGFRPGAGRRQRRGAQAGRVDPADLDPAGRAGASRPACPPTCSRCCPGRARWWASGSSPTRTCARSCSPDPPRSAPG